MSKILSIFGCLFVLVFTAGAVDNVLGSQEVGQVAFSVPVRVGTALLQPGVYQVRHVMEGENHVLMFRPAGKKGPDVKVKCTLVELGKKAEQTRTVYAMNAANERVLQELVLAGDTEKHVF